MQEMLSHGHGGSAVRPLRLPGGRLGRPGEPAAMPLRWDIGPGRVGRRARVGPARRPGRGARSGHGEWAGGKGVWHRRDMWTHLDESGYTPRCCPRRRYHSLRAAPPVGTLSVWVLTGAVVEDDDGNPGRQRRPDAEGDQPCDGQERLGRHRDDRGPPARGDATGPDTWRHVESSLLHGGIAAVPQDQFAARADDSQAAAAGARIITLMFAPHLLVLSSALAAWSALSSCACPVSSSQSVGHSDMTGVLSAFPRQRQPFFHSAQHGI